MLSVITLHLVLQRISLQIDYHIQLGEKYRLHEWRKAIADLCILFEEALQYFILYFPYISYFVNLQTSLYLIVVSN